jgi:hypothetical protein
MNLIGIAISGIGLETLGQLVASDRGAALPVDVIHAELDRLEPVLPTVTTGIRLERLGLRTLPIDSVGVLPPRAVLAHAIRESEPYLLGIERRTTIQDPGEREREDRSLKDLAEMHNPILTIVLPSLRWARLSASVAD